MDIAKLSMVLANAKAMQGIQISLMKKALEQTEQTGVQLEQMLEAADIISDSAIDISL